LCRYWCFREKRKRRGRERWGRKWVGERDQLCGEENGKRGFAGVRENEKIKWGRK
jgi:hypothetical protein